MKFNAKKCYILSMHSKRVPTLNEYRLKGEEIVRTSHHSHMGIELQDDGKWSKHVENCTKKGKLSDWVYSSKCLQVPGIH